MASVNCIRGGTQPNIIPDQCVIDVDRRTVPGETANAVIDEFSALLETLRAEDPRLVVELQTDRVFPPLVPETNASLLPVVQRCLDESGLPTRAIGAPFATHAGDFSQAGIPAVVIGPGDPTPAHTRREWIALDQLRQGVALYACLMRADFGRRGS